MKHDIIDSRMAECIAICWDCHTICLAMATGHCLRMGGAHARPEHLQTMHACADTCQAAANAMIMRSALHKEVCALCADVCDACIASCKDLGEMDECIAACKRCKDSCEALSAG